MMRKFCPPPYLILLLLLFMGTLLPFKGNAQGDCRKALLYATISLQEATAGRIVWQQSLGSSTITRIDVGKLPEGVYIFAAITPQGVLANRKLLVFH